MSSTIPSSMYFGTISAEITWICPATPPVVQFIKTPRVFLHIMLRQGADGVQIKGIAITRCHLLSHYRDTKEISYYYFFNTKLCAKREKTCETHLYCWDYVCKVNKWCLVDCFHREFRVSIQIMARDSCIAKCQIFSVCGRLLMALQAIFFFIQNIYVNLNPGHIMKMIKIY